MVDRSSSGPSHLVNPDLLGWWLMVHEAVAPEVYYSQRKISPEFRDGGSIDSLVDDLISGEVSVSADFLCLEAGGYQPSKKKMS